MSHARQFSPQNRDAFLQALYRIEAVNREPTPWEAACLFSALGAMTSGNEQLADQKIALCGNADLVHHHAWNVPVGLTVAGLRRTLAELSDLERAQSGKRDSHKSIDLPTEAKKKATMPVHHIDQPTCEWCRRGKLEVIKEWQDPIDGTIGVTLRCNAPGCARLTNV